MRVSVSYILSSLLLFTVIFTSRANASCILSEDEQNVNNLTLNKQGSLTIRSSSSLIISGEKPVNVNENGSMTLVSAKAIHFLPGTSIKSGGFMYASINNNGGKKGKLAKKEAKLVTVEENEKIEEQTSLAEAKRLFAPFHINSGKRQISRPFGGQTFTGFVIHGDCALSTESNSKQFDFILGGLILETAPIIHKNIKKTDFCRTYVECRYVLRL